MQVWTIFSLLRRNRKSSIWHWLTRWRTCQEKGTTAKLLKHSSLHKILLLSSICLRGLFLWHRTLRIWKVTISNLLYKDPLRWNLSCKVCNRSGELAPIEVPDLKLTNNHREEIRTKSWMRTVRTSWTQINLILTSNSSCRWTTRQHPWHPINFSNSS